MRQLFEPRLVNDPFGDPALCVDLRDERRALLFDLGDIAVLPPHQLLRVVLGRKQSLVLFGGPGRFDHEMPCLAFALEEKARPRVAKDRLAALGVSARPWLRELKLAILSAAPAHTPIQLRWRDRHGEHEMSRSVGELTDIVLDVAPGQRIGYVTDLRFTEANLHALAPLIAAVDPLFIESVFLDADRVHAQRKNHLTALQAGQFAREAGARAML
jgi:ribonuclease Z